MSIKLYANSIALPAPMKANSCDPVDSRVVVNTKSDLTNASNTWGIIANTYCPIYLGMRVYVENSREVYCYVGPSDSNGILASEVNKIANWRKISDPNSSVDDINDRITEIENELADRIKIDAVGSTNSIDLLIDNSTPSTPTLKGNVKRRVSTGTTGNSANIIREYSDGLFASASLTYNGAANTLAFNNGLGTQTITLNAGSIIDSITYDSTTEELVITYHTTSSSTPIVVRVPMKDLIEEYNYINKTNTITYDSGKGNVLFKIDRNVSGMTEVRADVEIFDCGTY